MTIDTTLHLGDLLPLVAFGAFIIRKLWALDIRMTSLHTSVTTKLGEK